MSEIAIPIAEDAPPPGGCPPLLEPSTDGRRAVAWRERKVAVKDDRVAGDGEDQGEAEDEAKAGDDGDEEGQQEAVSLEELLTYVTKELAEEHACKGLLRVVVLLMAFGQMISAQKRHSDVYEIERALDFDIDNNANFAFSDPLAMGHKGMQDVNSFADFWSWMRLGYVPLVVAQDYVYSERNPRVDRLPKKLQFDGHSLFSPQPGEWMRHNQMAAPIRIAQKTVHFDECRALVQEGVELASLCAERTYAPRVYTADFAPWTNENEQLSRMEWIDFQLDHGNINDMLLDMEDGCQQAQNGSRPCLCTTCNGLPWLREDTTEVQVSAVILNRAAGLWSLVTVSFIFDEGGRIWKDVVVRSQWADPYASRDGRISKSLVTAQTIWAAAMLVLVINVVHRSIQTFRRTASSTASAAIQFAKSSASGSSFVDAAKWTASLALDVQKANRRKVRQAIDYAMAVTAGLYVASWCLLVARTNEVTAAYQEQKGKEALFDAIERTVAVEGMERAMTVVHILALLCRMLHVMSGQPRIAIVTTTFSASMLDLVHFSVVFSLIFMLFGAIGYTLFGRDTEAFSSPSRALWGCARLLFGEFEWEVLLESGRNRLEGIFFVGAFAVLVSQVLLNMLLAIIIDSYCDVKAALNKREGPGGPDTLWSQASKIWRRRKGARKGVRMSLSDVIHGLKVMQQDLGEVSVVTPCLLRTFVVRPRRRETDPEEIPEYQAQKLLADCRASRAPSSDATSAADCHKPTLFPPDSAAQRLWSDMLAQQEATSQGLARLQQLLQASDQCRWEDVESCNFSASDERPHCETTADNELDSDAASKEC